MITVNLPNNKVYIVKNFSSTQLKQAKTCPKRWELMRVQNVPWKNNIYLVRGRNFHTVMETMHTYMQDNDNKLPNLKDLLELSESGLRSEVTPDIIPLKKKTKKEKALSDKEYKDLKLQELIVTSNKLIEEVYNSVDYKTLEVEISAPIVWHDLPFESRIDLLVKRGNKTVLVDHKTKSIDDGKVDLAQYSIYLKCLRENNIKVDEVEQWDGIFGKKPKIKKHLLNFEQIEKGIQLLDEDLDNILKMISAGYFPRNEYNSSCSPEFCPVWDLCRNPEKIQELIDETTYHSEVTGLNIV